MTTAQCSNCFFSFIAPADADQTTIPAGSPSQILTPRFAGLRFCNRNAPVASNTNPNVWLWPQVKDDFWCGEGADSATGLSYGSTVNGLPGANGAGYTATSTSNVTIASSGSQSFDTQTGLAYTAGARVRVTSTASGAWMEGVVTSYSGGTLIFTADLSSGSGAHTDWNINLAGQPASGTVTKGAFTFTASPLTVNDTGVQAGSQILLWPTNNTAATLCAGISGTNPGGTAGPFISSKSAGVSFTVTCGNQGGGGPDGTETFGYAIVN